jgi:hypothetical protein
MARIAKHSGIGLEAAKALLARAKNNRDLQQSQAGLTLEKTAELLGLFRDRVVVLRRKFREAKHR